MIEKAIGNFNGGIHPKEFKSISNDTAIDFIKTPKQLVIALQQNIGLPSVPIVKVGEKVVKNQLIAVADQILGANLHAPIDGFIEAIDSFETGHSSGLFKSAIVINTQLAKYSKDEDNKTINTSPWTKHTKEQLFDKINQAGIVGLGGATFPTHIKLASKKIKTLIVNAMECEPYITCDDRMLQEYPNEVIEGAQIAASICAAEEIIFTTEDNKPYAIKSLQEAIKQSNFSIKMSIVVAPTKYPSGGEKQLIELLFNKQLPHGQLPASIGVIIQNVATLFSIYDGVVNNLPLTKRLVTLTGDLINKPGNYWIPLGTQLSYLFEYFNIPRENSNQVIFGGPLMGQKITNLDTPITKSTNCIIFNSAVNSTKNWLYETNEHAPCIRCSDCEKACPVNLLPQQLYWFSQSEQWKPLDKQGLFDCIECGACAYVCPSEIPLVHYFRFGKSEIKNNRKKQAFAEQAKNRYELREQRLQRVKNEKALKHKKAAEARRKAAEDSQQDPSGKQTAINQALERVKQKKANLNSTTLSKDE